MKFWSKTAAAATTIVTLAGLFIAPLAQVASASDTPWHNSILWHNGATGESQLWYMDGTRVSSRATVLGEGGSPAFVGLPWSIMGVSFDVYNAGTSSVVWHNQNTGETQLWEMFNQRVSRRETVLGEGGTPAYVGLPFSIVAVGRFDAAGDAFYSDPTDDLVWHNSATGETQIWSMGDGFSGRLARVMGRATVLGETGRPAYVGLPWSIVGAGDFDRAGTDDLVWHNSATGETQIWLMNGHQVIGRRTVLSETGQPFLVGLPWSIVGVGDFNSDGSADLVWHNSATGETQIWLMNGYQVIGRRTVLGETGKPALVGLPWSIVGVKSFSQGLTPGDPNAPR